MALSATISASSSGVNQIVAAATNRRIRVLGYLLSFSGAVNAKWQDGSTDLTGLIYGAADSIAIAPVCPNVMGSQLGWFLTSQGAALNLNLSAGVAVGGHVLYDFVA